MIHTKCTWTLSTPPPPFFVCVWGGVTLASWALREHKSVKLHVHVDRNEWWRKGLSTTCCFSHSTRTPRAFSLTGNYCELHLHYGLCLSNEHCSLCGWLYRWMWVSRSFLPISLSASSNTSVCCFSDLFPVHSRHIWSLFHRISRYQEALMIW